MYTLVRIQRILARLKKIWQGVRNSSGQIYVQHRAGEYQKMWQAVAAELGAMFQELDQNIWQITLEGRSIRIANDLLEFDNPVTLEIAGRKPLVYQLLKAKGLPVPEHVVFKLSGLDRAYRFLKEHPAGCVIKPANGTSSGQGVTTHILTQSEARKAAILASLYSPELLVEPMIAGECYRLLVLDGRVIHAVRRAGPRLRGDGASSIRQLLSAENARLKSAGKAPYDIDRDMLFTLDYQGLSPDTVPAADVEFVLKSVNDETRRRVEVRTIYNETVTDVVCDELKRIAVRAAAALNTDFAGIDFITTDPTADLSVSGGVVNEINTTPGLHHHYDITKERYPKPALEIVKALLKKSVNLSVGY